MPDLTGSRWTRRSVLALSLAGAGVLLGRTPARATAVQVGQLAFEVPEDVRPGTADVLGRGWQWVGRREQLTPASRPAAVVLARADVASVDAEEVIGLLLAGSTAGLLPDLVLGDRRTRSMPGGGEQTRLELTYAATRGVPFHGTVLVAIRPGERASVLAVLGDETLTAGTIAGVLDSARWTG